MRRSGIRALLLVSVAVLVAPGATQAAFPGDNGRIALMRDSRDLVTVAPDGGDARTILSVGGKNPAWSPDGTQIALQVCPDVALPTCGIWKVNADGSGARQLTSNQFDAASGMGPSWSPDGMRIAFTRGNRLCFGQACGGDIHIMNADGSGLVNITNDPAEDQDPAWSPDGELIAFRSHRGGAAELYSMTPDGGDVRQLTHAGTGDFSFDGSPDWSPDGSKLVFSRLASAADTELFTVTRDGTTEERITTDPLLNSQPGWSPDGTRITMVTATAFDLRSDIYVINADGSGRAPVTAGTEDDLYPDWQPIPRTPSPDCSAVTVKPRRLWPPNHWFRAVTLVGPGGTTVRITGVTQDEPVKARNDRTSPDARPGVVPHRVRLRAERDGRGDGRVYRVAFELSDGTGQTCAGTVAVGVPRHKHRPAVDSAPPSFDSFTK